MEHLIQAEAEHVAEVQHLSFHGNGALGDFAAGLDVHDQLDVVVGDVRPRAPQNGDSHDRLFSDVGKEL